MKSLLFSLACFVVFLHSLVSAVEVRGTEVVSSTTSNPLVAQSALLHQDKKEILFSSSLGGPGQQRQLQTTWTQLGNDIQGEAASDHSGGSVAFSKGGSRLAIGAGANDGSNGVNSGHVRVYDYNHSDGNWVQVGNDIDGEAAHDWSGSHAVAMSEDGLRVAIGAPSNDGEGKNESGHVRVYEYKSLENKWDQVGNDIDGEEGYIVDLGADYSGRSLAMSKDGSRVAIGAPYNNGNGITDSGHVRVYDYNTIDEKWDQVGSDIDGGDDVQDWFGTSVAITEDGSRVAIGAPGNDSNGSSSGLVRVYDYKSDPGEWVQVGGDLIGENPGDSLGSSVAMNDVGSRVACGATANDGNGDNSGHVRVYDLNNSTSSVSWVKVGDDIDGEAAGDVSGSRVAMSKDGSRVAISAYNNDGSSTDPGFNSGHVRVFEYNSGQQKWVQVGNDIDGEAAKDSSNAIAMSDDGTRVAIGSAGNDDNGDSSGHVRVFSSFPPANEGSFEIHSTGNVTGIPINGTTVELHAPYNASNRMHKTTVLTRDCITPFTGAAEDAFSVDDTDDVSLGLGFISYISKIAVDISKVNTTEWWTSLSGGAVGRGMFDVCLESAVYFELPDGTNETMNFVNTNLTVTVEMDANFEVTTINAERKDASQEELNLDYSQYVEAYQCTADNLESETIGQYSQGDELKICVKSSDSSIVQVQSIKSLVLSQAVGLDSGGEFPYITDGIPVDEIAATDCDESTSVCHADMQLLGRYFAAESPGDLTASGSVELTFDTGRRLTVDVPIAGGIRGGDGDLSLENSNSARRMQQDKLPEESGFSGVQVSLKKSLDGSGGTNNFNGATVLSGLAAAAGGAILMA